MGPRGPENRKKKTTDAEPLKPQSSAAAPAPVGRPAQPPARARTRHAAAAAHQLPPSHAPRRTKRAALLQRPGGGRSAVRAPRRRAISAARALSACRAAPVPPATGAWSWSASSRDKQGRGASASRRAQAVRGIAAERQAHLGSCFQQPA